MKKPFFLIPIITLLISLLISPVTALRQMAPAQTPLVYQELEQSLSTFGTDGGLEEGPGQGAPAHSAIAVADVAAEYRGGMRWADGPLQDLFERFLSGESGLDFDEATIELMALSESLVLELNHDQAREQLLVLWFMGRFEMSFDEARLYVREIRSQEAISFMRALRDHRYTEAVQRFQVATRLRNMAGVTLRDGYGDHFQMLRRHLDALVRAGDWEGVTGVFQSIPSDRPFAPGLLAVMLAPQETPLTLQQQTELIRRSVTHVSFASFLGISGSLVSENLEPLVERAIREILTEPVPPEVVEALLYEHEAATIVTNFTVIGLTFLADLLHQVALESDAPGARNLMAMARYMEETARYYGFQLDLEHVSLNAFWLGDHIDAYHIRFVPTDQLAQFLSNETTQHPRYRQVVYRWAVDVPLQGRPYDEFAVSVERREADAFHAGIATFHERAPRTESVGVYSQLVEGGRTLVIGPAPEPGQEEDFGSVVQRSQDLRAFI